jgi:class 3 adenylate cyclase/tetratricopeptide (TPR) repeat protein
MSASQSSQTVHLLVPHFILDRFLAGEMRGAFRAVGLFCDISGFSTMTETLMQHGQHGTEVLAGLMRQAFTPLILSIYEQGGFIATQAGDAFTALFPLDDDPLAVQNALAAARNIQLHSMAHPFFQTEYGAFAVSAKVGLAQGDISWGIVAKQDGSQATFYFQGSAVDACAQAEHHARANQIIMDRVFYSSVQQLVQVEQVDDHYRLMLIEAPLPEPQPVVLPPPDLDCMARFFPRQLLTQAQQGEFRQTTTLFIHLPTVRTEDQLSIFIQMMFKLQEKYGGLLNRLDFGDKGSHLLLFWGAPVAYENDIERALNFILELQTLTSIPISAGLTHRISTVGFIGSDLREEYTSYGVGINLAARLMSAAGRDEIWMDEEVARRARHKFVIDDMGEFAFKGFAAKQKVFLLLERKERGEVLSENKFIGRKRELEKLAAFVKPVFNGQFPGSMVVWGEAGIGKTRLLNEFRKAAIFKENEVLWAAGNTDGILGISLNPFRHWLEDYFDVSDIQVEARNKRNFNRKLDQLILSLPVDEEEIRTELDRTRSFLGALLNLYWPDSLYAQLDAQGRYENTFIGLAALLKAESRRQPVVLLLEDAQWLDEDSRIFLQNLVLSLTCDDCPVFPIAILVASRITEEKFLPAGQEIFLSGLSWMELAQYAEAILANPVAPGLLDLLEQYAEGNPFFIEQILHFFQMRQLLMQDENGRLTFTPDRDSPLPEDIRLLLVSRLDHLADKVQQVVRAASVLGQEFDLRLLKAMLQDEEALQSWVHQAEQASIWSALSERRYLFSHALLRETAYKMQLHSQREAMHWLAVEALEKLYPDELSLHYAELAYHSEQGGLVEKARLYLKLAGKLATDNYQNSLALDYFSRALLLTPQGDLESRYELVLARESLLALQGRRKEQQLDLEYLAQIAQTLGQTEKQAEVAMRWSRYWRALGDYPQAISTAQQSAELVTGSDPDKLSVDVQIICSDASFRQGKFETALQTAEDGQRLALEIHWIEGQGRLLNIQGMIHLEQGNMEQAQVYFKRSLDIFTKSGDLRNQARPLNNLGLISGFLEDFSEAQQYYERALAIARQIGDRQGESLTLLNLGYAACNLGDFTAARSFAELSIRIARQIGSPLNELYGLLNLSFFTGLSGDQVAALTNADQALHLASLTQNRSSEAWAHTYRGHALAQVGRLDQASSAFRAALAIRQELGQHILSAEPGAGLARIALQQKGPQAALLYIEPFIAQVEAGSPLEGTDEPVRVYLTCYQILHALEDRRAAPILDLAHQMLQKRALNIKDEALRLSFLDSIPYHREVLSAWGEQAGVI